MKQHSLLACWLALFCGAGSHFLSAADSLEEVAELLEIVIPLDANTARDCLRTIAKQMQSGELEAARVAVLRDKLTPVLKPIMADTKHPLAFDAVLLAVSWGDAQAVAEVQARFLNRELETESRGRCLEALIATKDAELPRLIASAWKAGQDNSPGFIAQTLALLGRSEDAGLAEIVLRHYADWNAETRPKAIEFLTQRPAWTKALLAAVEAKQIPAAVLNASQLIKLQASTNAEIKTVVARIYGTIRLDRNPQREQVVAAMRNRLRTQLGNAEGGQAVFQKVCGQCHKIHGQGQDVGPDITANGRASFDQLLSNVFDPSLVIGPAYQARTVVTENGRILTGLLAEENEQRIVLKLPGGKVETISRDQVEEINVSPLSLMPEGLEKQLTDQELQDLFAFLAFDKPPRDAAAQLIPGAP